MAGNIIQKENEQMLRIVSATRDDWESAPAIAQSYLSKVELSLVEHNREGLPTVYNKFLEAHPDEILIFVHDDVFIEDTFWVEKLLSVMEDYPIVGLAGSKGLPDPENGGFVWWNKSTEYLSGAVAQYLSGAVAHPHGDAVYVTSYGPAPREVDWLDGLFLAVDAKVVTEAGVRFDERFDFHYYDMDFCLTARQSGLKLSTVPIWVYHESPGATTEEAKEAHRQGLHTFAVKWNEWVKEAYNLGS